MSPHELVGQCLQSVLDEVVELQWKAIVKDTQKMVISIACSLSFYYLSFSSNFCILFIHLLNRGRCLVALYSPTSVHR